MGLIPRITSTDSLALDTNIFIYAFHSSHPHHHPALSLLESIHSLSPRTYISALVFEEFLVKIFKQHLENSLAQYEDFLTAGGLFTVVDINREICRAAARLRATRPGLKAPDAIHLACALHSSANMFFTFDRRLPRKIDNLTIFPLA